MSENTKLSPTVFSSIKYIIPCSESNTDNAVNDFVLNDAIGGDRRPRLSPALVEWAAGRVGRPEGLLPAGGAAASAGQRQLW